MAGIAPVFGDGEGTFPVAFHLEGPEIIVDTLKIPTSLVEPATGVVDGAGGVFLSDQSGDPGGVKLSPALIEGYPYSQGRHIVKMRHCIQTFLFPGASSVFLRPGEQAVVVIPGVYSNMGEQGGHVTHQGQVIGGAATDHVLPDNHAQAVTMVIPAQGFYLNVFPQHVETKTFGQPDVEQEGLIAGGGHQAIWPIALVQQTMEEVWTVVQAETQDAFFIWFHAEMAHGKIAVDPVS